MKTNWFKNEKGKFFKQEKKSLLKPKITKIKDKKDEFTPKKILKTAGGLAIFGVGVHLIKELID